MYSNFLKITLRNLWNYKFYALINVVGLGVGLAAIIWAFQNYRFSFSYDNFHNDPEHVFRAMIFREGNDAIHGICPSAAPVVAMQEFSGIQHALRIDSRGVTVKADASEAITQQVHFTDDGFFEVFNFPLVSGTYDLSDPAAVLITEDIAEKLYGKADPIGKTVTFYAGDSCQINLIVKGVLQQLPMNSMMWFKVITHWDNLRKFDCTPIADDDWGWFADGVFFKLNNPEDAPRLESYLNKFVTVQNNARPDWKMTSYRLENLPTFSRRTEMNANGFNERPEDSAAYGPLVLAVLIFISACLNFTNTTISRSSSRLREMGVRKVMGGTRGQLTMQLLSECAVVVLAGILLSIALNALWFPVYNRMWEALDLQVNYAKDPTLQIFLLGSLVVTTVVAGAYPALYMSRFNPTSIFRGSIKFGGSNLFSRILLGLQIAIALITVIAGVSFARNAAFQKNYDFGYERENLLVVDAFDQNTFNVMHHAMQQNPKVLGTAGTRHHMGFYMGTLMLEGEGNKIESRYMSVGEGYLELLGLETATGRAFDPKLQSDYEDAMMITETLAAQYGWKPEEALGKQIRYDTNQYSVIGVLKDFHPTELFRPLEPVVMTFTKPDKYVSLIIRAAPEHLTAVFDDLRTTWNKEFPLKPFNGFYQDEVIAEGVEVTVNIAKIMLWFAFISVFLTATGLFALVSLTLLKKMKEIAVRKIVGASQGQLIALVNRGYIWIFLVAVAIGCYAGWYLTRLLMDLIFKVHVDIGLETMVISCIVLLLIAGLTISVKIWSAVRANPVESLRSE
ncbi:MAG TPA: ABC transporter permease [Saprospiraceae bacterium]|nr:ABC transporter permease [Saprospiraceae bacterium]